MNLEMALASSFMMGLASSTHCLGMCGGIAAAFGFSVNAHSQSARMARLFAYNGGRITTYVMSGLLASVFSAWLAEIPLVAKVLRIVAALVLLAMACYVGQWWMGLTRIEQWGQGIWRHIQPMANRLLPLQSIASAYMFGVLWGFLPCGLVYSMLLWVAARADIWQGPALMFAFGMGTLPAMVLTGLASQQFKSFIQSKPWRQFAALFLVGFSCWTLYSAFMHG